MYELNKKFFSHSFKDCPEITPIEEVPRYTLLNRINFRKHGNILSIKDNKDLYDLVFFRDGFIESEGEFLSDLYEQNITKETKINECDLRDLNNPFEYAYIDCMEYNNFLNKQEKIKFLDIESFEYSNESVGLYYLVLEFKCSAPNIMSFTRSMVFISLFCPYDFVFKIFDDKLNCWIDINETAISYGFEEIVSDVLNFEYDRIIKYSKVDIDDSFYRNLITTSDGEN